jgi:hypothetical protein
MDIGDASSAAADAAVGGVDAAADAAPSSSSNQDMDAVLSMVEAMGGGVPGVSQNAFGPSGMNTPTALSALNDMGFGNLTGFNPNNPTQSIAEMVAANNMHSVLNATLPTIMSMLGPPGTGLAFNALNLAKGLESGQVTPGQGLLSLGLGAIGVPGPVASALQGNLGQAASGLAQSGLASAVGNTLGIPAPVAGLGLNLSGIGPSIGQAVAGSVPSASSTGTPGGLAGFIDQALGGFSLGSIAPGTPPTAGSTTAPDSSYSADVFPVMAAIEQAAQAPKQPEWSSQMTAGRYGPLMEYEFGA